MPLSKDTLDQLLDEADGQDLFGQGGLISELTARLAERALEAEMTHHLGYDKHDPAGRGSGNSRNGHSSKTLQTEYGSLAIEVPRDRIGTFEPQIVPKHQRRLKGFDDKVIALYAKGMSVRSIQEHLEELYGTEVSRQLISAVTDAVLEDARAWQSRPLEAVYPVLFLDALYVKIRRPEGVRNCAIYTAIGINVDGMRSVLGLWVCPHADTERASFWLSVLTELRNRGVEDVFYCCVDGLTGFEQAIEAAFPQALVQQCVVHLVRQSLRYVSWKDRKAVAASLRRVYQAPTAEAARSALDEAKVAWPKYPHLVGPWERAWGRVVPLFSLLPAVRRALYTTNQIEALNRSLRSVVKTRGSFPSEAAALKVLYLAAERQAKKWQKAVSYWPEAQSSFAVLFPGRMPEHS
jgi:putative transposase